MSQLTPPFILLYLPLLILLILLLLLLSSLFFNLNLLLLHYFHYFDFLLILLSLFPLIYTLNFLIPELHNFIIRICLLHQSSQALFLELLNNL